MTVAPQLMDAIVTTNNDAMMRDFVEGTNPLLMYRSYSQIGCTNLLHHQHEHSAQHEDNSRHAARHPCGLSKLNWGSKPPKLAEHTVHV